MPAVVTDGLYWSGWYRSYAIPTIAIMDHVSFLAVVALVGLGIAEFNGFFLLVLLGILSCALRLREPSDKLPVALREPIFGLHMVQYGVQPYLNWSDYARDRTVTLLIEVAACLLVLFADLYIIIHAYQPAADTNDSKPKEQPPEFEQFTCKTEEELDATACGRSCAICLDDMCVAQTFGKRECEAFGRMECGHVFHAACLSKWLQTRESAPWCPYRCSTSACTEDGDVLAV
mmetsp:Transcript_28733/g.52348  ORF Transcript_28733/g.52348 Transcript_28733/m.52348 type:complete len:232 (-) Transcript_28733:57-752(-)